MTTTIARERAPADAGPGLVGRLSAVFAPSARRGVTARVSTTAALELRGPFEHTPFVAAQDGPFAAAQDRPFAAAQDRPFATAQDRAVAAAQDRPFAAAQDRPFATADAATPHFFLRNVTAGVFPGDVYDVALRVEPGARVAVGPTSATKVHGAPRAPGAGSDGARSRLRIEVLPGASLDYDAGVTILQGDADLEQDVELVVHPGGELAYREQIALGRLARGERLAFERYALDLRVTAPDGTLRYRERATLRPAYDRATLDTAVGGAGVIGTLLLLGEPARALERAHALADAADAGVYAGASELPHSCGAIVRALTPHPGSPFVPHGRR